MTLTKEEIQEIIDYEIVVDCYTEEEANMGWAIYMEENISYPFEAEYEVRKKGGKNTWAKVSVISNETDEANFTGGEYYIELEYNGHIIIENLNNLKNIKADDETMKVLQVWKSRNDY